jgi:hypothetical protein
MIKIKALSILHLPNSTAMFETILENCFKRKERAALKSQNGLHEYPTSQECKNKLYVYTHTVT